MRTFETMKTPPTRERADVQLQARLAPNPVNSHTHVQRVAAGQLVNRLRGF
jgi:hypothetical protein